MSESFEARLKAQALGLGFDLAGVTALGPATTHDAFARWLADGRHGEMDYLARGADLRRDTTLPEPGMRAAVVVALDYGGAQPDGPIAKYARGDDYHRLMWDRLETLLAWVRAERGDAVRGRAYVDTGPILERDLARKAGLGWFGKNTMLIHPERGSFFFLGALFLDLDLASDAPFDAEHCGSCTRCLDACPTQALVEPGVLDARQCISYLTIELRGEIPPAQHGDVGDHLFGCDICQDVCPWNVKFARAPREQAFNARAVLETSDVSSLANDLLAMTDESYAVAFRGSAMKRAKLSGLQRNAKVVLRNLAGGLAAALLALPPRATSAQQTPPPQPPDTARAPVTAAPIIVRSTRSGRRVEDEPLKVEVLAGEEVEEKLLMTPGDITMMLNETSGLRVQTTSPGLGGANVRIQGLRGRYSQILVDGLPLHGAQTGGLGLLQIPPMDLGGVEVIKGVSSALYGGSALGGVINLVSREPHGERVREFLVNGTSLGGVDAVSFGADDINDAWGYTLLAGAHGQSRADRDGDGWADLAQYERGLIRPRLFWRSPAGHTAMFTVGGALERRTGGTMPGDTVPDGTRFRERLRTTRLDAGAVARIVRGSRVISLRGSASSQGHAHEFGPVREDDAHVTWAGEASIAGPGLDGYWVLGAALQQERYRADDVSGFGYVFTTPGFFAQHTLDLGATVALSASARVDAHSAYGAQWSPRLSALWRVAQGWSLRASAGGGYFAPTPFTEEVEVVGLTPLDPLDGLKAERARSGSLDLAGMLGAIELNASVFASEIDHAIGIREVAGMPGRVELVNADVPTRTQGAEMMLRARPGALHLSASSTWLRATELDVATAMRRDVPLTPRHTIGFVGAYEVEDAGRIGLEVYRTGRQSLSDDPFRTESVPYVHIGVLIERHIGRARIFLNAENLLDYRQTKDASLVRPTRGAGGRWTTDVWGPLDGRVFNLGLRLGAPGH